MAAFLMNATTVLGVVALLTFETSAAASPKADALGACLVDSLDGKERKQLARWVFFGIAAHPEIASYPSASKEDIDSSDQYVARLVTRLLVVDCPTQLKAANTEDPLAAQRAFELVGKVAMQEIMSNQLVSERMASYVRYTDRAKISAVLSNP